MPLPTPFYLRTSQNTPLTYAQLDGNFTILNTKIDNTTASNIGSGIGLFKNKDVGANNGTLNFYSFSGANGIVIGISGDTLVIDGGGSDTNFATTDLTFTGDRTHDLDGYELNLVNSSAKFQVKIDDPTNPVVRLTGNTSALSEIRVVNIPNGGLSMGHRGNSEVSFPGYGKQGDGFIYSSAEQNGLNILSQPGTTTEDYIRFYAGQDANGTTPDLYIQGSGVTRGFVGVNMDNPQFTLDVAGETRMSGSGQNILTIIGSGDTQPLFKVEGSSGDLFTITDSLYGSLFSVNDISGLRILEVFDDNIILMGSYQAPSLNTTVVTNPGTGLSTVYSLPMTSGYTGAFFDYTVSNTGGARAGTINTIFSGGTAIYTEFGTSDIGDTTDISFDVSANTRDVLLQVSAATTGWQVKTIVRSI